MDGRLSRGQQEQMERHLGACPACRAELDSLRAAVQLLGRLHQAAPPRSFAIAQVAPSPRRSPLPALRLATAVVTALLVFMFAADMTNLFEGVPLSVQDERMAYQQNGGELDEGEGSVFSGDGAPSGAGDEVGDTGDETVTGGSDEAEWVRPVEYSLLGMTMVLGGTAAAAWLRQRKAQGA